MGNRYYKKAYDATAKELAKLLQKHAQIEKRMLVLRQNLTSLAVLCRQEDVDVKPAILTDALRGMTKDILSIVTRELSGLGATKIRDQLKEIGYDLRKYKNPLADIHQALKRLEESGRIESTIVEGKKCYRRKTTEPPTRKATAHHIGKTTKKPMQLRVQQLSGRDKK